VQDGANNNIIHFGHWDGCWCTSQIEKLFKASLSNVIDITERILIPRQRGREATRK